MLPDHLLRGLDASSRLVVLTGTGISDDSGVPTFCGPEDEWRGMRPEQLATLAAFRRDPKLVWEWYDMCRGKVAACRPNAAHEALARLEQVFPNITVITQSVDGLHRTAGSRCLLELNGDLWRMRCVREGTTREDRLVPMKPLPPHCECGALLRPDVAWSGEVLDPMVIRQAINAARVADLCLVIGTSALLEPAASLPYRALEGGARVMEVDLEQTSLTPHAHIFRAGQASERVPQLVELLLESIQQKQS